MTHPVPRILLVLVLLWLAAGGGLPVLTPPAKVTAVTYFYNEDQNGVPSEVTTAISKLNEQNIVATVHEVEVRPIPKQHAVSQPAAEKAGLPALVVMAGDKVLRIVKAPTKEADVLEAAK